MRYESSLAKVVGTTAFMTQNLLYTGIALYAPSIVLSNVTGLPDWGAILLVTFLGTSYTAFVSGEPSQTESDRVEWTVGGGAVFGRVTGRVTCRQLQTVTCVGRVTGCVPCRQFQTVTCVGRVTGWVTCRQLQTVTCVGRVTGRVTCRQFQTVTCVGRVTGRVPRSYLGGRSSGGRHGHGCARHHHTGLHQRRWLLRDAGGQPSARPAHHVHVRTEDGCSYEHISSCYLYMRSACYVLHSDCMGMSALTPLPWSSG